MLTNYFKLAWRNIRRDAFYSFLHLFGLSLAIACSLILFLFIRYHVRFETYHPEAKNIYRVVTELDLADGVVKYDRGAPLGMAPVLQAKDVATILGPYRKGSLTITVGTKRFSENQNVAFTDRHWFSIFDYHWIAGDPQTALEKPNTAVLTRAQANKFFGKADPIGQTFVLENNHPIMVTGVLDDLPDNTDNRSDIFLSLTTYPEIYPDIYQPMQTSWGWISSENGIWLKAPGGTDLLNRQIAALTREHFGDNARYYKFRLIPLNELHYDTHYGAGVQKSLLWTLGLIGGFILLIACVNFINLATAQHHRRAREIGTRKLLGSTARAIYIQFLAEAACLIACAVLLGLGEAALSLPILNPWLQTNLAITASPDVWSMTAALAIVLTLGAGTYPSWLASRFTTVETLKSKSGTGSKSNIRKGLILVQNLVAQSLIIATLVIALQMNFVRKADLGFNQSAVVMVPLPKGTVDLAYLRGQLANYEVSFCYRAPDNDIVRAGSVKIDNRDWAPFVAQDIPADDQFVPTFGLHLIAGRNLTPSDTVREILINETLVHRFGFAGPESIIGHRMVAGDFNDHPGTIVGVVKDFHVQSLHNAIEPLLITTSRVNYLNAAIRIPTGESLSEIGKIWQSTFPGQVFQYHFVDARIALFYAREDLFGKLIRGFAGIAILISGLGLLGLISLLTVQRTREIGIRKVIGASTRSITLLLTSDFLKLVALSALIASPLADWLMSRWLQGFAYRISIPWWLFVVAAVGNLTLSLLAVAYHSVRAARANPIDSLRNE